ncbi:unnamed protein product, partial [marine sediment metagenome]
ETTRNAPGDTKYVIVNADEGDPGAYMDRSLLEGNPHSVLEGLLIGAYAIGSHAYDSEKVAEAFVNEIERNGLKGKVDIRRTGCHGFCERGTIVVIFPEETCYLRVKPEDVPEIVSTTLVGKKLVDRLLYEGDDGQKIVHEGEIPFYKHQSRIVFGNNRFIDPKSIDDYIALGGYSALAKALFKLTPEQVLEEVKKANLRGRGGGGFPAGIKWETTRNAPGDTKYVIVNADEGDPGAYMDRSLLEGNPHSVLEGLLIGAYAIGSHAYDSEKVAEAFVNEIERNGLKGKVDIRRTGCHGFCERGTIVVIFPEETCYLRVKPEDVPEIVSTTLVGKKLVDRLLYEGDDGQKIVHEGEIPFYKHQSRIVFGNNRFIDPKSIDDYIALGGYSALAQSAF